MQHGLGSDNADTIVYYKHDVVLASGCSSTTHSQVIKYGCYVMGVFRSALIIAVQHEKISLTSHTHQGHDS